MGLFKEYKEDFLQAVNELVPGGDLPDEEQSMDEELVVDTLGENVDVHSELSKLDGLLEQVKEEPVMPVRKEESAAQPVQSRIKEESAAQSVQPHIAEEVRVPVNMKEEKVTMSDLMSTMQQESVLPPINSSAIADETSTITAGTTLSGDIQAAGSLDIQGTINGNVSCNGKLVVTGTINGNSSSSEFFADSARIEGEVVSSGTIKIGSGTVIIGNLTATSAVIAGAVKGDIDVQGPVVVDTSAVVMGNIKSRSVQINNGAVIEGFCSQCYSDINVQELFNKR